MEMGERGAAKGEHVLAIQIRIEYWDGTVEWLTSDCDNCFCSSFAPAVQNSIYRGETHDARLKQEGFDTAEFTMDEGKRWEKRSGRIPRGERSVPR